MPQLHPQGPQPSGHLPMRLYAACLNQMQSRCDQVRVRRGESLRCSLGRPRRRRSSRRRHVGRPSGHSRHAPQPGRRTQMHRTQTIPPNADTKPRSHPPSHPTRPALRAERADRTDAPLAPDAPVAAQSHPSLRPDKPAAPSAPGEALEDIVSRSIPAIVSIETGQGRGSGFFAASKTVITNRHVIQDNVSVTVRLSSGQTLPGRVDIVFGRVRPRRCSCGRRIAYPTVAAARHGQRRATGTGSDRDRPCARRVSEQRDARHHQRRSSRGTHGDPADRRRDQSRATAAVPS